MIRLYVVCSGMSRQEISDSSRISVRKSDDLPKLEFYADAPLEKL